MADHLGSAFGALAGAALPGAGADLPLSPQWRQPFGRTTSVEQPMKSALIGPWDGNNSGAPASKPDAAAKQPGAAWRGPDGPPSRDPKWPEKDRPDYNGARDRPAPAGRWREREEDSRDRNNTWEADRWGSVEEPRRWQEDRGSDRWGDASGRGRGRPPADERWVDRKPSGTPTGEREWLPGMPPEPELPKRPSIQDRWASESTDRADRRSAEDRWRTPGGAGASLAGGAASAEIGFTSTHAGRGRGFALGRGRGMKSSGPAAPGSGVPDRWDAARASHVDRQDSMTAAGGNGVGGSICGGSQSGVRKYSPPQMSKIFNHLVSSHGDKLPMPRINPEVAMQYSEYLAGMAAEAAEAMAAAQLGGNGSNSGPTDTAGSNALSAPSSSNPAQQSVPSSSKPPLQLPVTHELYLHDQWVYKDPQGVTQGPFSRLDILDWLAYNYFGEDLPIRAAALESAPFIPLGQMMKMWDAIEHGRPIGPPGFAPAAPPVIQPVSSESVQQQVAQQQPAPASAPVASMSSMGSAASQSVEISQQPPQQPPQQASNTPAAGSTTATSIGSAQRTSSLLETLLGRKLASEPAPSVPQQSSGALSAAPQGSVGAGAPVPEIQQQPGPFTLDPPVQLHNAGSSGIGAGSLGGLGSLGGPLGGGFNSGLPGSGMGPGGMSGMGPGGMGPGAWGTPLGGPGGPLPGGPGGPMLPGWGREPLVGGYDPLRRPDMHPGMHAGAGIWGNAPYRPEGPHLGPGPFVPNQAPPEGPPPTGRSAMPDAMLGVPSVPAPGPGPTPASAPAPAPAQQQLVAPPSPQPSAWSAPPVANVGVARSLADIQREQAMEAARLAALREHQQHQQAMAEAASQQGPPPPAPLPQELQAQSAWGGNAVPDAYRPISGLPPALQQIFAAANKPAQAGSEASIPPPPPESGEALESATVLTDSTAAGSASGKKKKTPQLVLQEQPKMQPAPSITAPPAVIATSEDAAGAPAPPRPEPKLAPWALTAAVKPPTAGMTLREIQMQEAEAAARAARASAAAQEAAATQNAVATAAATPAAPAPASASPWAKIAAVSPGPNNTAFSPAPPPAPPAAASAWRPTAAPAAPSLPAVPSSPAPAAAVADSSPSRKSAPVLSAAAAVVAPAARGGRPAPAPAQAADSPPAPVGVTGTAPRGTTLAELLEKQLNPASAAPAQTAPKAWGGAASKPPPVTNLRAVLYEESAADLEGGAVDEDLSDVLPMLQQKQQQQLSAPAAASTNGGWAAAPAPPPGPTLRDIQQQEEEARRRAAAAAQPPARAASATVAPAAPATSEDDGLFWDYTPAPTSAPAARAAPVEAPKPAPAAKPAAPAPQASGSTSARGGWASAVGAPAPVMTAAALAAKGGAAAAPAARMPAAAVAGAKAAPAMVAARSAAPAPATSTSYAPAPAAAPGGEDAAGLFDGEIQMSADFRNWCRSKMVEFFGNDDLSLVHFLLTVSSRSEVADYCQMYMRGKPNVSTFVAEFLKRKDADLARSSSSKKGKGGSGGGATAKGVSTKGVSAVSEWQKAASSVPQTAAGAVKKGTPAGGKAVKKVGGITATVPGFSLLSDRA